MFTHDRTASHPSAQQQGQKEPTHSYAKPQLVILGATAELIRGRLGTARELKGYTRSR
jgi:hypothetical protein